MPSQITTSQSTLSIIPALITVRAGSSQVNNWPCRLHGYHSLGRQPPSSVDHLPWTSSFFSRQQPYLPMQEQQDASSYSSCLRPCPLQQGPYRQFSTAHGPAGFRQELPPEQCPKIPTVLHIFTLRATTPTVSSNGIISTLRAKNFEHVDNVKLLPLYGPNPPTVSSSWSPFHVAG